MADSGNSKKIQQQAKNGKCTGVGKCSCGRKADGKWYKTVVKAECPHCHSDKIWYGINIGTGGHQCPGKSWAVDNPIAEGHYFCCNCGADFCVVCGNDHGYSVKLDILSQKQVSGLDDYDGDTGSSDDDSTGSSGAKSAWDICKEVAGKNNDDVVMVMFGDTLYLRRLSNTTYSHLDAFEDYNIVQDSITITEANPLTTNTLELSFGGGEKPSTWKVYCEPLVKRYGEIKETMNLGNVSKDEAVAYGKTYLNKLLRDSGITIECKVIGHPEWYTGRWCRFYSSRYNIDKQAFFISKISQSVSATDPNQCDLTLVEYAPDLTSDEANEDGIKVKEESKDSSSSDDDSDSDSDSDSGSSSG